MARPRKVITSERQEVLIKPLTAAIYLRVSTEDQATKGFGLNDQLSKCKAMAAVKGWAVAEEHIFTDAGLSGTLPASKRPGLSALLKCVKSKAVGSVIISGLDRLVGK